jgi:uncharacterized membrane protein YeaQ/YmgE (transglycosylase-associated protein family)
MRPRVAGAACRARGLRKRAWSFSPALNMNIVLWFTVGSLVGWLMSRVLAEPGDEHTAANLTVGLVSATLAGWFLAPWARASGSTAGHGVDFGALVMATLGALVALTAFNLVRKTLHRH